MTQEIDEIKAIPNQSFDPKTMIALQVHLKNTKERLKEMESYLNRYAAREKQFISLLERITGHLESRAASSSPTFNVEGGNLDQKLVEEMAQKISIQYLKMDWDHVIESTKPPSYTDSCSKIQQM